MAHRETSGLSQGFIQCRFRHHEWDITHPSSSWAGMNSPPGAAGNSQSPKPAVIPLPGILSADRNPPAPQNPGEEGEGASPQEDTRAEPPHHSHPSGHLRVHSKRQPGLQPLPPSPRCQMCCSKTEPEPSACPGAGRGPDPSGGIEQNPAETPKSRSSAFAMDFLPRGRQPPYPGVTHSESIKVFWSRMFSPLKGASSGSQRFTVQKGP